MQYESGLDPVQKYLRTLWQLLTRPSIFYRGMPIEGGLAKPLAFALVTHWIGQFFSYIWLTLSGKAAARFFSKWYETAYDLSSVDSEGRHAFEQAQTFLSSWPHFLQTRVILDPFFTVMTILGSSCLIWAAARMLISPKALSDQDQPREVTYEGIVRIICYAMSPAILAAIPLIGGMIGNFCILLLTVIGIKEVYRTSSSRATLVALFPMFLFLGIILLGVALVVGIVMKLIFNA